MNIIEWLTAFLSVNNIAVNVLGYDLSWIELIGTVFYFWGTILCVRRNVWQWPVGIVNTVLYMILFYQIQLYSDTIEQIYFLVVSLYGWYIWHKAPKAENDKAVVVDVRYSQFSTIVLTMVATFVLSLILSEVVSNVHLWLPSIFPLPASYPYLDSLTTAMSFVAIWLLARKRTENWAYWVAIDCIGAVLYSIKDVKFVALQFFILIFVAIRGWYLWRTVKQTKA